MAILAATFARLRLHLGDEVLKDDQGEEEVKEQQ